MIQIELLVSQDLYKELGFYPKMTLIRSEREGFIKFVPTSLELVSSFDFYKVSHPENDKPFKKTEVSSSSIISVALDEIKTNKSHDCLKPTQKESSSFEIKNFTETKERTSTMMLEKDIPESNCSDNLSSALSSENTTSSNSELFTYANPGKKTSPFKHLKSSNGFICEKCKIPFQSRSGYYKHRLKCHKSGKTFFDQIEKKSTKLQKSISLSESGLPLHESPKDETSSTVENQSSNNCVHQRTGTNWILATRKSSLDKPSYFVLKKT